MSVETELALGEKLSRARMLAAQIVDLGMDVEYLLSSNDFTPTAVEHIREAVAIAAGAGLAQQSQHLREALEAERANTRERVPA
jgi:hypothetical protein